MIWPTTSIPRWAKALSGESCGTIHLIDSMIVWGLMTLNFEFRFRTTLLLGARASDISDPLVVGYLLELFCELALAVPTMLMQLASMVGF
jgi:hypothetical protein